MHNVYDWGELEWQRRETEVEGGAFSKSPLPFTTPTSVCLLVLCSSPLSRMVMTKAGSSDQSVLKKPVQTASSVLF
jgi:hypothetical protein